MAWKESVLSPILHNLYLFKIYLTWFRDPQGALGKIVIPMLSWLWSSKKYISVWFEKNLASSDILPYYYRVFQFISKGRVIFLALPLKGLGQKKKHPMNLNRNARSSPDLYVYICSLGSHVDRIKLHLWKSLIREEF